MKRIPQIWMTGFVFLLTATGCGHAVLVKGVETAETKPVIPRGTSFFVEGEPGAAAEVGRAEVEADRAEVTRKIEGLLEDRGYTVTSQSDADYSLRYSYEITPLLGKMSLEHLKGGPHMGMGTVRREGPFNHRLYLWVAEVASGVGQEEPQTVWAGGGILNGAPTDSSRFLDLLLVATFKHFLKDTGDTLETRITLSDPRVRRLRVATGPGAAEAESTR